MSPSGKAEAFDASMRRFESYHPSHYFIMNNRVVFTGNSNPKLAAKVAKNLGVKLGSMKVGSFSDGEINVEINENVRGKDTFIIQSTNHPAEKNLMELILIIDALKRASVKSITAVYPILAIQGKIEQLDQQEYQLVQKLSQICFQMLVQQELLLWTSIQNKYRDSFLSQWIIFILRT